MQLQAQVSDLSESQLEELYVDCIRNLSIEDIQFIESKKPLTDDMLLSPKMVRARELFNLLNPISHV